MTPRIALALLIGAVALAPGLSRAGQEGHSLEQLAIEMAQTPEQHAAVARHYRAKAEDARAEARRHESMARTYAGGKLVQRQRMRQHYQKLAEQYTGMAQEFEALAKLHEDEASRAK